MKAKLALSIACALLAATAAANADPYVVTIDQVGANVVATGSGNIDLTGLNSVYSDQLYPVSAGIWPTYPFIGLGSGNSDGYSYVSLISGPTNFGTGGFTAASSVSGGFAGGVLSGGPIVPAGYVSDTLISDSATFANQTLASLGLTPGIYTWIWGTASPDQSFTIDVLATPLPGALPLFATGLGALGLLGWRRKKKAAAS